MPVIPFSFTNLDKDHGTTLGEALRYHGFDCPFNHNVIAEMRNTKSLPVWHQGEKYYINTSIKNYLKPEVKVYWMHPCTVLNPIKETAVNSIPLVYTQEHSLRRDDFVDLCVRYGYNCSGYKNGSFFFTKNNIKYKLDTKGDVFVKVGTYWLNEVQEVKEPIKPKTFTIEFRDVKPDTKIVYHNGHEVKISDNGVPSCTIGLFEKVEVSLRDGEVFIPVNSYEMTYHRYLGIDKALVSRGYTITRNDYTYCSKHGAGYAIVNSYPHGVVIFQVNGR